MAAVLETIQNGLLIRWGPEMEEYGDPYIFSVVAEVDGDSAFLKGGAGTISTAGQKAIFKALREVGVHTISWERKKRG
jgi:hypothetical protein